MADRIGKSVSQRQLRVGEMIKQSLSMIFLRNEEILKVSVMKKLRFLI